MAILHIIQVPLEQLHPHPRNAHTHPPKQVAKLAASIRRFGFNVPILIDATNQIICGHARVDAATDLGLSHVPAIRIEHLSKDQVRAFLIADNKLAEGADWNVEILAEELQFLTEVDIDPTITGFETPEIDILIDGLSGEPEAAPETAPEPDPEVPAVTELGDRWILGNHFLSCGDATRFEDVDVLMDGAAAQMVFIDPPYNVPVHGHVSGKGKFVHREFPMASGEMDEASFTVFLEESLRNLAAVTIDGGLLYTCMDWRHLLELQIAADRSSLKTINLCVWTKTNGGMGSLYRSQHELVFVFKVGTAAHINNVELGRHGRNRTNVWHYAGVNTFREGREADLRMHPTLKPLALVADAIRDVTHRSDIVLDTFVGSGTTIIACEQVGRRAYAMELDPLYVDTAIRRWQAETSKEACLASTGESFAEIAARRGNDPNRRSNLAIVGEPEDDPSRGSDAHG